MKIIQFLLTQPILRDLSWALLHFLWQGALLALLLAGLLTLLRAYSPQVRYLVASFALLLMPILPLATILSISHNSTGVVVDEASLKINPQPAANAAAAITIHQQQSNPSTLSVTPAVQQLGNKVASLLPLVAAAWLLGVLFQLGQFAGGFYQTNRLKQRNTRPVAAEWQEMVVNLAAKIGISRPVQLLESSMVNVPTVIGWLQPIILLPPSVFTGLSTTQLELIIAHELAHIRRYDYLVNLLQTAIETLLFYHPAVWWISRQIRVEREQACDDLVVSMFGNPLVYARALTKIEHIRKDAPQLAVAANGGVLLQRIRRLMVQSSQYRHPSSLMVTGIISIALILLFGCVLSIRPLAKHGFISSAAVASLPFGSENRQEKSLPSDLQILTNNLSSKIAPLVARDNITGENLEMRRAALTALADRAGSVIVMDAKTGQIQTIVNQEWALRRNWQPASTIKLITTTASLMENVVDPAERIRTSNQAKPLNLTDALAYSDNSYFKLLGERVGAENMIKYAHQFGFGEATGINYENELPGQLPVYQAGIDGGNIGAFGEGIQVTPIQLAVLTAAIANGGTIVVPQVLREGTQFQPQVRRRLSLPQTVLSQLSAGMTAAVRYGTAKPAYVASEIAAGKTGTTDNKSVDTGLFISYAPISNPDMVVVVVLTGKDVNGALAADVAGKIYRTIK